MKKLIAGAFSALLMIGAIAYSPQSPNPKKVAQSKTNRSLPINRTVDSIELRGTGIEKLTNSRHISIKITEDEFTLSDGKYQLCAYDNKPFQKPDGKFDDIYFELIKGKDSEKPYLREHHSIDNIKEGDTQDLFLKKFHEHYTNKETYYKNLPPEAQPGQNNYHRWKPQDKELEKIANNIVKRILFPEITDEKIQLAKK